MFLHENSFKQISAAHNPKETPFKMFTIAPFEIRNISSSLGNVIQETGSNSTTQWTRKENSPFTSSIESFEKRSIENDYNVQSTDIKMRKNFFPHKLMEMLASPEYKDCIAWRDDGKAFYFVDREKFIKKMSSANLRSKSYKNKSFTRKLNRWGFRMLLKKGANHGMYYHELFQRDKPWLCSTMVPEKSNDPKEVELSSHDEADGECDRKTKSPDENIIGHRNDIFNQSTKKRRLSKNPELD